MTMPLVQCVRFNDPGQRSIHPPLLHSHPPCYPPPLFVTPPNPSMHVFSNNPSPPMLPLSLSVLTTMPRRSKTRTKRNFKETALHILVRDGHPVHRLLMHSCSQGDHADMKYAVDTLLPGIESAKNALKMIIHDEFDIPQNIPSPFILNMSSVQMDLPGLSGEEEVSILELLLICGKLSFVTLTTVHKHMGKSAVGQTVVLQHRLLVQYAAVVLTPFPPPLPFNITLHLT